MESLTTSLTQAFEGVLTLVPPLARLRTQMSVVAHPLQKHIQELPAEQRLAGLRDSVQDQPGRDITIEVWWATEEMRDLLVERARALLTDARPPLVETDQQEGLRAATTQAAETTQEVKASARSVSGQMSLFVDADDAVEQQAIIEDEAEGANRRKANTSHVVMLPDSMVSTRPRRGRTRLVSPPEGPVHGPVMVDLPNSGGARLVIVPRPLGALGDPLAAPENGSRFLDRTLARVKQVVAVVPPAAGATLALVELPNYRDPSPARRKMRSRFRRRDPKIALRLGLARTGRVSQFVTPPTTDEFVPGKAWEGLVQRAGNAVLDGLRQLGFLPAPIGFRFEQAVRRLPEDLLVEVMPG